MTAYLPSLLGGMLIGLSAVLLLALNGRVAGISGIVGRLAQGVNVTVNASFVAGLLLGPVLISGDWCEIASVIVTSFAIPAGAMVLVLVFELDHLQRCRMDLHLDRPTVCIAAVDFIAAVIDLDTPHRPSIFGSELRNCRPRLPIGHRHQAVVITKSRTCRQDGQHRENCQRRFHRPSSGLRPF